jgi:hypothetical protein
MSGAPGGPGAPGGAAKRTGVRIAVAGADRRYRAGIIAVASAPPRSAADAGKLPLVPGVTGSALTSQWGRERARRAEAWFFPRQQSMSSRICGSEGVHPRGAAR